MYEKYFHCTNCKLIHNQLLYLGSGEHVGVTRNIVMYGYLTVAITEESASPCHRDVTAKVALYSLFHVAGKLLTELTIKRSTDVQPVSTRTGEDGVGPTAGKRTGGRRQCRASTVERADGGPAAARGSSQWPDEPRLYSNRRPGSPGEGRPPSPVSAHPVDWESERGSNETRQQRTLDKAPG